MARVFLFGQSFINNAYHDIGLPDTFSFRDLSEGGSECSSRDCGTDSAEGSLTRSSWFCPWLPEVKKML